MVANGWTGQNKRIYWKYFDGKLVRVGVYVDDCVIGGDRKAAAKAYTELYEVLGYTPGDPWAYPGDNCSRTNF